MGEIADGLINGDFDFYTGEYLGRGYGFPRTHNRSLPWERQHATQRHQKDFLASKEAAYNGIKNLITQKWSGRKDIPSTRSLVYEYTGQCNFDLKEKCIEIQKDFGSFVKFINKRVKS